MKIALLLSIVCATAILSGCSSTRDMGGASDRYQYNTGTSMQTEPAIADPSLPQDPNVGPSVPPP